MRKPILPRFKSLLSAACAALYTRQVKSVPPALKYDPATPDLGPDDEAWLFEADATQEATRVALSKDMNALADDLSDLRETLALIHGETPFPVEATTLTPCAVVHHDEALFDGEVEAPYIPAQEEVSGGEGVFLFGDAPTFQDEVPAQQHAA
ncbi:MAG: hypothetical protein NXH78_06280 [Hyphomonadaceae bacterium]|nr:hypothetical protein [Hyphomonadaceae bacterium]